MEVNVRNGDVEQAIRVLKKRLQKNGNFRELKMRRFYEKPSEERKRRNAESDRRRRKHERKRREILGF